MGDEVLKTIKVIILTLSLIISSVIAKDKLTENFKDKLSEYDKFFSQISEKRVGVENKKIDEVKNPFIMTYNKIKVKDGNSTVAVKKSTYILNDNI